MIDHNSWRVRDMRLLGMVLIGVRVGAVAGSLTAVAVVAVKGYWYLTGLSAAGGAIVGGAGGTITFSKPSCAACCGTLWGALFGPLAGLVLVIIQSRFLSS